MIPKSITSGTDVIDSYDEEATVVLGAMDTVYPPDTTESRPAERTTTPEMGKATGTPLPLSPGGNLDMPTYPDLSSSIRGVSTVATVANVRRSFAPRVVAPQDLYPPATLSSMDEVKEGNEEEENVARMPPPTLSPNASAAVLKSNFDFVDDDSDNENVCAICLSGYGEFRGTFRKCFV